MKDFYEQKPHEYGHYLDPIKKHKGFIMRLIGIIILTTTCLVSSFAINSAAQLVSINRHQAGLQTVLNDLREQTGYGMVINEALLKKAGTVNLSVNNVDMREALDILTRQLSYTYTIPDGKTYVVIKADAADLKDASESNLPHLVLAYPEVRGRVLDSLGNPLQGATVRVLNAAGQRTALQTKTDTNGAFRLLNVENEGQLEISFIGYHTAQLPTAPNMGNIVLRSASTQLDEAVVQLVNTGYQQLRPEQSTGAVSQISTKEFESRISTNFLDGLTNRMPGLMINNNIQFTSTSPSGGGSSSRPLFNIRGISTMSANQSPLIVIDGYPTELTLEMIDPNEIKSVTLLKDAAASTVYGVRASNGVIVIERKQAQVGGAKFSFRATAGITPEENYSRYRWSDNASAIAVDYHRTRGNSGVNSNSWDLLATGTPTTGGAVSRSPVYYIMAQEAANMITPEQAAQAYADLENYDNLADYQRLFTRPTVNQSYNFNMSGGSANASYYVTANYIDNLSNQIGNNNNRFLLSARSNMKLSERLSLELTTDYQERRSHSVPGVGASSNAPFVRFEDANGDPTFILGAGISPWYNAVIMSQGLADHLYYPLIDRQHISDNNKTVNNRITADFRQVLGAGFDLSFGGIYETSSAENRYYAAEQSSVARRYVNAYVEQNTDGTLRYHLPKGGYLHQNVYRTSSYTARAQLNYNKTLAEVHTFNGILGAEARNLINSGSRSTFFGYNDETLLHSPVDLASMQVAAIRGSFQLGSPFQNRFDQLFDQRFVEDRFISGYANLVYSYRNTYSLSGSIRVDQSNLFGTNPKYKYKPLWSLGAAWNIHQEEFMQDVVWVNQLKLRVAHGFNGNVAKMSLPEVIARSASNPFTSPASPSLTLVSYANSSLRWEQTNNFNAGLDYTIFRGISGSIDYYQKKSTDLMGNAMVDPTLGVSPTLINQASIRNDGIELGVRADWIAKPNFNWNSGIVVAYNTSKVLDVFQRTSHNPSVRNSLGYVKDYPVGALFAYRYAGLDSAGFPLIRNEAGRLFHTDDNRTGSPTDILMSNDTSGVIRYMGTSIPTINAGLSNRVDFGNFYIFAMLNYYGGFKLHAPRPDPSVNRPLAGAETYWRAPGDEANTDVMQLTGFTRFSSLSAYNFADSYVVRGDYVSLGDLTISYRLNNLEFIKKAGFSNFEIKGQASNIWTVGFNRYNYSRATGSFQKTYMTPTYTIGIFTNF